MNLFVRICAGIVLIFTSAAQNQAPPAFEVVSIKNGQSPLEAMKAGSQTRAGTKIDAARADFASVVLESLITRAYHIKSFQISGPPDLRARYYDSAAKLPEGSTVDQVPEMLKTMLSERFKMAAHFDTKEFAVYAMVVGKDGPKFNPKPADYDPASKGPLRPVTMDSYAGSLIVDRPVFNETGLQGEYMLDTTAPLRVMMERAHAEVQARQDGGPTAASDPATGAIFEIVQKLGLKIEPRKVSMPHLVIDHIEFTPTGQ
jgi:uncharacterized protein (TIGR03435 family)